MSTENTPSTLEISSDRNGYFVRFETCSAAYAAKRQHDTQPELLAALLQMIAHHDGPAVARARAAICDATGAA